MPDAVHDTTFFPSHSRNHCSAKHFEIRGYELLTNLLEGFSRFTGTALVCYTSDLVAETRVRPFKRTG
jgi:hypothetical protein